MSDLTIRQLFESRLLAWADQQALPVLMENVRLDPLPAGPYLAIYVLPGFTTSQTLAGDHTAYVGVVQIDIRDVAGGGVAEVGRIAGLLAELFPTNLVLMSGAFSVQQVSPLSVGPGLESDGRYVVPCSFRYRADTT